MRAGVPPSGSPAEDPVDGVFRGARVDSPSVSIPSRRSRILAAAAGVLLVLAGTVPVLAHAELVSSDPADGSKVAPPTTITLTFSEGVNAKRSSFNLNQDGQTLGTGKAAADGDTTMTLDGLSLDPGAYAIQWTSVAADGDLLRGTIHFTVLAATAAPSAAPTDAPSASAAAASASPTPAVASSEASVLPTPVASADTTPASSSGTDVLFPIVIGLLAVAAVGAFLLRRTRRA